MRGVPGAVSRHVRRQQRIDMQRVEEILFSAIGAIVLLLIVRLIRTGGRF